MSGNPARTSAHEVAKPSGRKILFSSATVSWSTQSFSGLITTVSPSNATGISTNSIPASEQRSISFALTGRLAPVTSVSPAQNRLNPPPVPDTPTVTSTPPFSYLNASATASVIGNTVLDPSIWMSPLSPSFAALAELEPDELVPAGASCWSSPPQAASTMPPISSSGSNQTNGRFSAFMSALPLALSVSLPMCRAQPMNAPEHGRLTGGERPVKPQLASADPPAAHGTEKPNVEPSPTSLSSETEPPCTSAMCRTTASPSPVPDAGSGPSSSRDRAASAR